MITTASERPATVSTVPTTSARSLSSAPRAATATAPPTWRALTSAATSTAPSTKWLTPDRCLKIAHLGEDCESTIQCATAYATCDNSTNTCVCVAGAMEYIGKECLPSYRCPNGDPPMKDPGSPFLLECKASTCPLEDAKPDTCPDGSYCVFPSYQNTQGFCCPSRPWCPAGAPHPDAKCKNPKTESERCPPETHHCYTGERGTYCCPLPCPSIIGKPAVIVNGTCYSKVALRDECQQSLQCPSGAVCGVVDPRRGGTARPHQDLLLPQGHPPASGQSGNDLSEGVSGERGVGGDGLLGGGGAAAGVSALGAVHRRDEVWVGGVRVRLRAVLVPRAVRGAAVVPGVRELQRGSRAAEGCERRLPGVHSGAGQARDFLSLRRLLPTRVALLRRRLLPCPK